LPLVSLPALRCHSRLHFAGGTGLRRGYRNTAAAPGAAIAGRLIQAL